MENEDENDFSFERKKHKLDHMKNLQLAIKIQSRVMAGLEIEIAGEDKQQDIDNYDQEYNSDSDA